MAYSRSTGGPGSRVDPTEPCHFGNCQNVCFAGLPVCFLCAIRVGDFMCEVFDSYRDMPLDDIPVPPDHYLRLRGLAQTTQAQASRAPAIPAQSVVYYLMLSPVTVKIGTTTQLKKRMSGLRTESQYIVALEPGDTNTERMRHIQFKAERRDPRREDFNLSDALKQHIDALLPQRSAVLAAALGIEVEDLEATA